MVSSVKTRVASRVDPRLTPSRTGDAATEKFSEAYREPVKRLCASAPAIADLATSFPGMLFALASGYGTQGARDRAIAAVVDGRPLKDVAAAFGLPWWLRKLPAEAFTTPLTSMPGSGDFARRIVNHVPTESWRSAGWLERVQLARELGGDDVALWMAWRSKGVPRLRDTNRLVLLCAWAWFSQHPETEGYKLVRQPFETSLGLRRALDEAELWRKRLELAVALGDGIADPWFGPAHVRGHDIVPLTRLEDFLAEAEAMDNCLDQFAPQVHVRRTRLFSIRKGSKHIADVELALDENNPCTPMVEQLRGPGNRSAAQGVWQTVFLWLSAQPQTRELPTGQLPLEASAATARRIWRPFLEHLDGQNGERALRDFLRGGEVLNPGFDPSIELELYPVRPAKPRSRKRAVVAA